MKMEEEKENNEEIIEERKQFQKEKIIKGFFILLTILSFITTLVITFGTDANPIYFIIIFIIILLISFTIFFGHKVISLFKVEEKEEKVPPVASQDKLREIVKNTIEGNEIQDHTYEINNVKSQMINDNLIYNFKVKTYLTEDIVNIIINANYPDEIPTIIREGQANEFRLRRAMNDKAKKPLDEPTKSEIRTENVLTGNVMTEKKTTPTKKEDKNKKKKEDSVV